VVETVPLPEIEKPVVVDLEVKEERHMPSEESTETKIRRSFLDKYVDKIKEFLDNAE
jgi:cell division protein FtsA